jgi:hypothetical protein
MARTFQVEMEDRRPELLLRAELFLSRDEAAKTQIKMNHEVAEKLIKTLNCKNLLTKRKLLYFFLSKLIAFVLSSDSRRAI